MRRPLLRCERRDVFPATVAVVWARLREVERFPDHWRWLRELDVQGGGLTTGGILRGRVVPPVPYPFEVAIQLVEVVPQQRVRAALTGDVRGRAALDLRPHPNGCETAVRWLLELRSPALRAAAVVARPVLVRGHDQVVSSTVRRFVSVVAEEPPSVAPTVVGAWTHSPANAAWPTVDARD